MHEFAVRLVSNACIGLYPSNRLNKFTNVLKAPLHGHFYVSLRSIAFGSRESNVNDAIHVRTNLVSPKFQRFPCLSVLGGLEVGERLHFFEPVHLEWMRVIDTEIREISVRLVNGEGVLVPLELTQPTIVTLRFRKVDEGTVMRDKVIRFSSREFKDDEDASADSFSASLPRSVEQGVEDDPEGRWEIAMSSITYTPQFKIGASTMRLIGITSKIMSESELVRISGVEKHFAPPEHTVSADFVDAFKNPKTFAVVMKDAVERLAAKVIPHGTEQDVQAVLLSWMRLSFTKVERMEDGAQGLKVNFECLDSLVETTLYLPLDIAQMLGLRHSTPMNYYERHGVFVVDVYKDHPMETKSVIDVNVTKPNMLAIYTDFLTDSLFGGVKTQILDTFPIMRISDTPTSWQPRNLQFVRISATDLARLTFWLRRLDGSPAGFAEGVSVDITCLMRRTHE